MHGAQRAMLHSFCMYCCSVLESVVRSGGAFHVSSTRQYVTTRHASHSIAGSHGSGVAQVLSVDDERQSGNSKSSSAHSNGDSRQTDKLGKSNGNPGASKASGVSLFGSYKAPVKSQ